MNRYIPTILAALALAGCSSTGALTPQAQQIIGAACKVDTQAQPIAVAIVPTLVPQAAPGAALDNALIHPLVVAACANVGGTPAAVTLAPLASATAGVKG